MSPYNVTDSMHPKVASRIVCQHARDAREHATLEIGDSYRIARAGFCTALMSSLKFSNCH